VTHPPPATGVLSGSGIAREPERDSVYSVRNNSNNSGLMTCRANHHIKELHNRLGAVCWLIKHDSTSKSRHKMKVPLALDLVFYHNPIIHGSSFIRVPAKTDGCIFCALPRNIVQECPSTLQYDNTGHAIVNSTSPTDSPSRTTVAVAA
jgi:hypothetical protein